MNNRIMKIAISGASGFIGTQLSECLNLRGHQTVPLGRDLFESKSIQPLIHQLGGCDAVINLAGESINKRWTEKHKEAIYHSRIDTTRKLVDAVNAQSRPPELFISTSAVGYYPSEGCYSEWDAVNGPGFLAKVCRDWEQEVTHLVPSVRRVITRFGLVMSARGGIFPKFARPAKMKVSIRMGSGQQNLAWIDLLDLLCAMEFILDRPEISGPVNFVSPRRLTYSQFAAAVSEHYHDWITLPVPRIALQLALGESSQLITQGQCVSPEKLLSHGFTFQSNNITDFLNRIEHEDHAITSLINSSPPKNA